MTLVYVNICLTTMNVLKPTVRIFSNSWQCKIHTLYFFMIPLNKFELNWMT